MSHTIHYTKSINNYVANQTRDGSTWTDDEARITEHHYTGHPLEAQLHPKFDCPSCLGSFATPDLQEHHFATGGRVTDLVEEADRFIAAMPDGAIIRIMQIPGTINRIREIRTLTGMSLMAAKMFTYRVEVREVTTYELVRK
jgi:hypothetical protein